MSRVAVARTADKGRAPLQPVYCFLNIAHLLIEPTINYSILIPLFKTDYTALLFPGQ
jgi:hypothetical protein